MKLAEVCRIVGGGTPSKKNKAYYSGNIPWASVRDMNNPILTSTEFRISDEAVRESATNVIPAGEVIISTHVGLGKVCILAQDTAINQDLKAVIPTVDIDRRYLYHWFVSQAPKLVAAGKGATVKGVTVKFVLDLDIPVPSQSKQRAIAKQLSLVLDCIGKRQAQFAHLDALAKSLFVEMFGDPVENPMRWATKSLPEIGIMERGVSKARPRNAPELLGGPYPLIQTGDVAHAQTFIEKYNTTYSKAGLAQSRMWPKGTLCITIAANIAETAILQVDACFPDSIVGFIANSTSNIRFIHIWFQFFQSILEKQAPMSAQKNINLKTLASLEVIVPPIVLQRSFAERVEAIDKSKFAILRWLSYFDREAATKSARRGLSPAPWWDRD